MLSNRLGNFVRERRLDLGLSQEELAERMGGSASQAEVSRLERGSIAFPRRQRLEALAAALEVTIGTLLIESRWLSVDEDEPVERMPAGGQHLDSSSARSIAAELATLRVALSGELERLRILEATLQGIDVFGGPVDVNIVSSVFNGWGDAVLSEA